MLCAGSTCFSPDLLEVHQRHPARIPCLPPQAVWAARKANANTGYKQYMPIREGSTTSGFGLYRSFTFGKMATLVLPETRWGQAVVAWSLAALLLAT